MLDVRHAEAVGNVHVAAFALAEQRANDALLLGPAALVLVEDAKHHDRVQLEGDSAPQLKNRLQDRIAHTAHARVRPQRKVEIATH